MDIESWRPFIDENDFDRLKTFVTATQNGEQCEKLIILQGNGNNGKTTFIDQLSDSLETYQYMDIKDIKYDLIKPNPSLYKALVENPQLIVLNEVENISSLPEASIKEIIAREKVSARNLHVRKGLEGTLKGNFIMCTNDDVIDSTLYESTKRRFDVIRFTHRFN